MTGRSSAASGHGVLIVDDDQFIRKLIATTLEDVAEFDLHEAADGPEAIEVARRTRPTLVFLDVDMPRLNGIEACRRLRDDDAAGEVTIVMLTAASGDSVESEAERAGADCSSPSRSARSTCCAWSISCTSAALAERSRLQHCQA
jgi:two-component system chemotaxis response regulator CheY